MYRVITTLGALLSRCSPKTLDRLARGIAFFLFDILRFRRALILRNLTTAFGNERTAAERVRIGRDSVKHFLLTLCEFLSAVRIDMLDELEVEGLSHVQAVLAEGKGAYFLCGHLGNWEAMGAAGHRLAAPTHAIVKEVGDGSINQLIDELRNKSGLNTIYRKPAGTALRSMLEALERNELVAFMLDQSRPRAPRIPFFGTPAKTQTSLASLWRRKPRPIIPVSIRRIAPRRHVLTAWPPLDLDAQDRTQTDVETLTERFNEALEKMIRTAPEQYFWFHNRWKP